LKSPGSVPGSGPAFSPAPFLLASALAAYQQRHNLDDAALAAVLGCALDVLTQLRLCRRPGAALPSRTAVDDVADIAARFGPDAAVRGRGRRRLRTAPAGARFLLGARSPVE
jgi:hypothetical protein